MLKNNEKSMDKIVDLCKSKGYVYPGSEIYGGLANTWDYGPLGVQLKNNIKNAWLKKFVQENKYNVGLDSAILMNPQTWVASGHIGGFSDPLMDCKSCKTRHRADNLIEDFDGTNVAGWSNEQMTAYIKELLAALLLGSVVYSLDRRNTMYNKVATLNNELELTKAENVRLQSELDSKVSAKNVEDYAENVLGMQKIDSSQIKYIKIQTGDVVSIPAQEKGIAAKIKAFFDRCVEYFRG